MKKNELLNELSALDIHPGKKLGQNFLIDGNFLDYIIRTSAIQPGEIVLEAGPGFGVLSRALLEAEAEVYAVEFDHRICAYLQNRIRHPLFHLTEGDACRIDFTSLLPHDKPFRTIANLPYAISSVFIAHLLEFERLPTSMLFMLQKEMALRLGAACQTPNYSALSVQVQQCYDVRVLRKVPPQVFFPPPRVESALVEFSLKESIPEKKQRKQITDVVRLAFSQRRKKVVKVLASRYGMEKVLRAMGQLDIAENARPTDITVATYEQLTTLLRTGNVPENDPGTTRNKNPD